MLTIYINHHKRHNHRRNCHFLKEITLNNTQIENFTQSNASLPCLQQSKAADKNSPAPDKGTGIYSNQSTTKLKHRLVMVVLQIACHGNTIDRKLKIHVYDFLNQAFLIGEYFTQASGTGHYARFFIDILPILFCQHHIHDFKSRVVA